jgi:hypothetical protein
MIHLPQVCSRTQKLSVNLKDNLKMQLVSQALNPLGAGSFLGSYVNSSPLLAEQTNDMYQYFQGLI